MRNREGEAGAFTNRDDAMNVIRYALALLLLFIESLALVVGLAVFGTLIVIIIQGDTDAAGALVFGLLLIIGCGVAMAFTSRHFQPRATALGVCASCGYDLRGIHSARCPECGHEVEVNEPLAATGAESGSS